MIINKYKNEIGTKADNDQEIKKKFIFQNTSISKCFIIALPNLPPKFLTESIRVYRNMVDISPSTIMLC